VQVEKIWEVGKETIDQHISSHKPKADKQANLKETVSPRMKFASNGRQKGNGRRKKAEVEISLKRTADPSSSEPP